MTQPGLRTRFHTLAAVSK